MQGKIWRLLSGSSMRSSAKGGSAEDSLGEPCLRSHPIARVRAGFRVSASIRRVLAPCNASRRAKFIATVDLPSLGKSDTSPMIFGERSVNARLTAALADRKVSANAEKGLSIA